MAALSLALFSNLWNSETSALVLVICIVPFFLMMNRAIAALRHRECRRARRHRGMLFDSDREDLRGEGGRRDRSRDRDRDEPRLIKGHESSARAVG